MAKKRKKEDSISHIKGPSKQKIAKEGFFILSANMLALFAALFLIVKLFSPLEIALAQDLDKEEIGERNVKLLLSPEVDSGSFLYSPKKGESLYDICRKFNMSPGLIKEINGIGDGDKLAERLKIVRGDFSIVIEREKNILTLYRDGKFFKEYKVATGRNLSTPPGEYTINSKLITPPWIFEGKVITPQEPGYPLGTRWMGLSNARIGIHGTKDPQFIGQYVSSGCIRMVNEDIEELFKIVPFGTKVIIKE